MDSVKNILTNRGFQIAVGVSATVAGVALAQHLLEKRRLARARQSWNSQPADVVVLHQVLKASMIQIS
jgi:hypothetical protein